MLASGHRLRLLIVTMAVAIMAFGAWQLPQARQEMLPEFGPVYVEVQTEALGLSAQEVEDLITVPMEQNLLNGVAWLDEIHSQSITGLSSIVLIFEPGTDPLRARQVVAERLTQNRDLPKVSKAPVMLQPLSSASRVLMVRLTPTDLTPIETSVLARWTIRPALMGVPGVANVSIWGQRERQLQVQVDPAKLHAAGIRLEDIVATTGNALWVSPLTFLQASAPGTGGFIDTPNQRIGVQHLLPISSPEELALVPIEGCEEAYSDTAACPKLGDVATVVEQHQPLIGDSVTADSQDLLLIVEKFPDADTAAVTDGINDTLAELAPGLNGMVIDSTVFERQNLIDTAMQNLSQMIIVGMILAVVVIFMLLFDWRSALICAVTIPLSLVAAALVLYIRGETFNTVMIAGLVIALGVVIDDVVIDVENIARRLRQHRAAGGTDSASHVVVDAALEMRSPTLAATAIVLLAALPVLFLGGLFDAFYLGGQSGAFFKPIVVSYVLAIVASTLVALIVSPTLSALLLTRAPLKRQSSPIIGPVRRGYVRLMRRVTPNYGLTGAIAIVILAIGLALLPQLRAPASIVPTAQDRDLLITWNAATGTSLPEMQRITSRVSAELRDVPGVNNVGAHVGRAIASDQVVDVHAGELWVSLDSAADYDDTVAAVTEVVQGYPGIEHEVMTYLDHRLDAVQTNTDDVILRIYGQDMEILTTKANEAHNILNGIDGVSGIRTDLLPQEPQVQVEVDLEKAQQYGLKPGEVRRTAATLVTGIEVGSLFEEQKVFEVMVVGVPEIRGSLTSVENILIDTPNGDQIRLSDVASVRTVSGMDTIKHDAVSRYVDVIASVEGRSVGDVVGELESGLTAMEFPLNYHAEVVGNYTESRAATNDLIYFTIGSAVGVFLILQAIFRSWRLAALVFVALPTSLVGGTVLLWIRDDAMSLGAILGFLAVLAIAARNSTALVNHFQKLEMEEGVRPGPGLFIRGAEERMGPMLVTTLATAVAVLPFVIVGSIPGLEILHPMAIVTLGGLVTMTIVNLFILPSLAAMLATSTAPAEAGSEGLGLEPTPAAD
jgi:Cu/Ag efflux pump CusA